MSFMSTSNVSIHLLVMAFQPTPVYTQSHQTGQTTINQTVAEIGATGKTSLPPVYATLPNVGQEEKKYPVE